MQNYISLAGAVRHWLAAPVFVDDEDKTRVAGIFNTLILSAITIWSTAVIAQIFLGVQNPRNVPIILVTCVVFLAIREAARRGYVTTAVILFCSVLLLAFVMVAYNNGTVRAMGTAAMMVCVIVPTLLIGTRTGFMFVVLAAAFVLGLSQAELAGALPPVVSSALNPRGQWVVFTAIILFHWALVGSARNSVVEALTRVRNELAERKRLEVSLHWSEQRFRRTLDAVLEGCQIIDPNWHYVYVNQAVARQSKCQPEELVHRTMMEVYPGIEDTELFRTLQHCMENRVSHQMENEFRFLDHSTGWFDLWIQPVPEGILIFSVDITARKEVEKKLRENEARLQAIIDNYPFQVFVKTVPEARYILGNRAWQEMQGIGAPQGQSDSDLFPEDAQQLRSEDASIVKTGKPQTYERIQRHPHGQKVFNLTTKFPLYNSEGMIYAIGGVSTDITALKQAEQLRAHAETELQIALKRTKTLYDITRTGIASWTVNDLLEQIAHLVAQGLPANRVALVTFDPAAKKIENFVRAGPGEEQVVLSVPYDELMEGLSGWAIRTGQSVLSYKNPSDPRESKRAQKRRSNSNCGSILVTPLQYQGQKLGTLTAINLPEEPDFADKDVELLEAIAGQAASIIVKITLEENLHRSNERLAFLHQITLNLLQQNDLENLTQTITDEISQLLMADGGYLALVEGDLLAEYAITPKHAPYEKVIGKLADSHNIVQQVLNSRETFVAANFSSQPEVSPQIAALDVKGAILLPLLTTDTCQGVLGAVRLNTDKPFTEEDVFLGSLFTRLASLALENTRLRETLRQEAIRDPLTGLFNRRFMQEALLRELNRADRHSLPLAIAMLDLDFFKTINDTFGHDAGDEVLRQIGSMVQTRFRGSDIACRYGGEEFTLILPEVLLDDALVRMEELRRIISQTTIQHRGKAFPRVTISIGVAQYVKHGSDGETLLKAADEALYRAKQSGRDRVISA